MANKTITMSKGRQILRLYTQGKSKLFISEQTATSRNTVKKYLRQFIESRLSFEDINELSDQDLDELFGKESKPLPEPSERYSKLLAFFPYAEKELKRKGVTLELIWKEYLQLHPDGYKHSQFGHHFNTWLKRTSPVMHMQHKAGDKMYVDFAREKLQIVDKETGEIQPTEVFVAILGASQLTYVEATSSQQKEDFITCCEKCPSLFWGSSCCHCTRQSKICCNQKQ